MDNNNHSQARQRHAKDTKPSGNDIHKQQQTIEPTTKYLTPNT